MKVGSMKISETRIENITNDLTEAIQRTSLKDSDDPYFSLHGIPQTMKRARRLIKELVEKIAYLESLEEEYLDE